MSSNEMSLQPVENEFSRPVEVSIGGQMAVSAAREAQAVIGMISVAKRFPRDKFTALNNILDSCQRYSLAEKAEYAYPRGGQTVKGPSIRLAEVIAQSWGNLDFGVVEIERRDGESIMQAYCWDLETNVRRSQNFNVSHSRDVNVNGKKIKKSLTDERDIYEMTANQGSRRVRSCILAVIPGDVTEKAQEMCRKIISAGKTGKTKDDRILDVVRAFDKQGVPQVAIEKKIGHKIELCTDEELAELIAIGNSIHDGVSKRQDWFDLGEGVQSDATKDLNVKFTPKKSAQNAESVEQIKTNI
jgi:hypothetical protein